MASSSVGVKRTIISRKRNQAEAIESEEEDSDINQEEDFLTSITNEDADSTDAEDDDDVDSSDEEDDEVVYETDDGGGGKEEEEDDDENDDSEEEETGGSDEDGSSEDGDVLSLEPDTKASENSENEDDSDSKFSEYGSEESNDDESEKENDKNKESDSGNSEDMEGSGKDNREQNKLKNKKPAKHKTHKQNKSSSKIVEETNKKNLIQNNIKANNMEIRQQVDEYKSDSSDEEDIRNTVGNIPMNWYDDYKHLGYDWEGKRILKPAKDDELDNFLKRMEDPNFWRTVKDPQTGQDVVLCDKDVEIIQRLQSQKIPDSDFDDAAPWIEWFTSEVMQTPIVRVPDHKRSFLPSKLEAKKVAKMVHAIKMGWMKPREEKKKSYEPNFYMLWQTDEGVEHMRRIHNHIPAPKRNLPGHAESYNPPSEYLFDKKELKEWNKLSSTPYKRKLHFLPQKYSSLRVVPAYDRFIIERFQRCLDLYLCPRARKMRLTIEPEDLLPQLPSPKDLQPFPNRLNTVYEGHTDMVRSIAVEPKGQYLVSGSDDLTVKVWEISTGRCVRTIPVGGIVRSISWCPSQKLSLIAVAADRKVLLINPGVDDLLICSRTDSMLDEAPKQDFEVPERVKAAVQWEQAEGDNWKNGIRIIVNHFKEVKQVTWHGIGDYFATECLKVRTDRPFFFVATQKNIRVYDLTKQEMVKKLYSNSKWISSMAIHPGGDNLLVGTYDRKMLWFDLDLSTKPYQTLRLHGFAVRGVAYHKQYPLFASGSDDRSLVVCHGMVYSDLLQNPLIVPLKRLSEHEQYNDFGIFDVAFHPTQPWVFSSGADKTIRLYIA
ncbi:hypothetical protein L9F63_011273 [Diploptera punctata]|uniref:Ribosome biogenesis protein BOP1 homolog n=1 Tax=Diploptera punctata TaxID=6984 RepID=A0AAD8AGW0_DIPPU|nr:hypothetical protein L9F63_011273 [Diploptera punctata]